MKKEKPKPKKIAKNHMKVVIKPGYSFDDVISASVGKPPSPKKK